MSFVSSCVPRRQSLVPPLPVLLAALCITLIGIATAAADPIAVNAVYGFAEQKVYGMTLSVAPGASGTLVGTAFNVKMSNKAAFNSIKQPLFCKCRDERAGHLAFMFR